MKKYLFLITFFVYLLLALNTTYCAEEGTIRVGLEYKYKSAASVPVSNKTIAVGYDTGGIFSSQGELNCESGFTVKAENRVYIKLAPDFKSYSDALNSCQKIYGQFSPYPALMGNGSYSVYVGPFNSSDEAKRYMDAAAIGGSVAVCGKNAAGLYAGSELALISDSPSSLQIKASNSEPIELGDRSYRGAVEFINNSASLTAVNVVDIDEYCYSVVGSEVPSEWHIEALKAQAVACRTYSSFKRDTHTEYDMCDGTHCQLYKGIQSEAESVINAVNQTKGIMAYYNDEPINAVYCSSNGGYSADSLSVWNYECGYLKAVEDSTEEGGKLWNRSFTQAELTSLAGNIGTVTSVIAENDGKSNRVNKLTIKGTAGEKVLEAENIRTFFSSTAGGSLESRNFIIEQASVTNGAAAGVSAASGAAEIYAQSKDGLSVIADGVFAVSSDSSNSVDLNSVFALDINGSASGLNPVSPSPVNSISQFTLNDGGSIVFSGKGWGHGVGMSQYGAKSMAEKGYTYEQILKHYYTGINLK